MPKVSIAELRRDGGTQPRAKLNDKTANEYAEILREGGTFPPVTVFYDGSDYWLADGFHRVRAHELVGLAEIEAEVRQGTQEDAILFSLGANATHGLPRSPDDKERAVLKALEKRPKWSNREIARQCVVSAPYVATVKERHGLTVNAIYSEDGVAEVTYTTKHGTEARMKTQNIGRKLAPSASSVSHKPDSVSTAPENETQESRREQVLSVAGKYRDALPSVEDYLAEKRGESANTLSADEWSQWQALKPHANLCIQWVAQKELIERLLREHKERSVPAPKGECVKRKNQFMFA